MTEVISGSAPASLIPPPSSERPDNVKASAEPAKSRSRKAKEQAEPDVGHLLEKKKSQGTKKEDDTDRHTSLVLRISRYQANPRFGPYLKGLGLNKAPSEKATVEELQTQLKKIRYAVAN